MASALHGQHSGEEYYGSSQRKIGCANVNMQTKQKLVGKCASA